MDELPQYLDKTYYAKRRAIEMESLSQLTGMTPAEIDADLSAPDKHASTAVASNEIIGKLIAALLPFSALGTVITSHNENLNVRGVHITRGHTVRAVGALADAYEYLRSAQ